MIKYFEFDSIDQYGQHIVPINTLRDINLTKTAASNWAPELMKIITGMQRDPKFYYVVINALGSFEVWGPNKNGDGFPEKGLRHHSLRSDMGTPNDYGYKTFEYYAKLYKHHVNKNPDKSFGIIIYSYWNDILKRVELIVGIDREKGKDIVSALENNELVSVSMGCKVRYDRCSICDNQAKTLKQYCIHLKDYMGKIVTDDLAKRWSRELNRPILPGTSVFAWNDYPRFFDISKVFIGADRTSYILGKAASSNLVIPSACIGEVNGVTDEMVDKLAILGKNSEISKEVGSESSDVDGKVTALKGKIDNVVSNSIDNEPRIPAPILNAISSPSLPLSNVLSTLLHLGIHPKPTEFQRIVLINIGEPKIADYLDDNNMCFDHMEPVDNPIDLNISENNFNDIIAKALIPYLEKRSSFPSFLEPRLKSELEKNAAIIGNDSYWLESGPQSGPYIETSPLTPEMKAIGGLAAIYAGLKARAAGMTPKKIMHVFHTKPWLRNVIGGGILLTLMNKIMLRQGYDEVLNRPASDYAGILQDTNFSGHIKTSSVENALGLGILTGALALPAAYIINAYNRKSLYNKGIELFPGAGLEPKKAAGVAGLSAIAGASLYDVIKNKLRRIR